VNADRAGRPGAWGPDDRHAAVAVTFDNLGEATDLQRGLWPDDAPLGRHPSVTRALPRVLTLLTGFDLPATFFLEGVNAELYPRAVSGIDAAGHEIAYHGWCHEPWADLSAAREHELIDRGLRAVAALGLRPVGFRPPGGALAPSSPRTLAELGFTYCSPAGRGAGVRDGVAVLPFDWTVIDAFHYLPNFAGRRRLALGRPDPLPPGALAATLTAALDRATGQGRLLVAVFHPFLADTDDRLSVLRRFLGEVRALVDARRVWCAPLREIAAWMGDQEDADGWEVALESSG
jgi:peptidoglycan/xylan/chitin deacetylase (PgdA/CDA1 family)